MLIEGKFTIKSPIQKTWDLLLEPETLRSSIPGCEKMEAIDEKTYDTIISIKVGPVAARFKFITTLVEVSPPTHLKVVGKGEELSKAGTFSQETIVDLKEISAGEVEVSYRSDVNIVGRLASFGDRILIAKAKEIEEIFTSSLNKRLVGEVGVSELKVSIWETLAIFFTTLWKRIEKAFKNK